MRSIRQIKVSRYNDIYHDCGDAPQRVKREPRYCRVEGCGQRLSDQYDLWRSCCYRHSGFETGNKRLKSTGRGNPLYYATAVLAYFKSTPSLTAPQLAVLMDTRPSTARHRLLKMYDEGILEREFINKKSGKAGGYRYRVKGRSDD